MRGNWFKLICGASFQALPDIHSLVLAYTLAGADCIDIAADPAVITAAKEAIAIANTLRDRASERGFGARGVPWLMVSLNDGEDPHFRKAQFDSTICPSDCPQPCLKVCPAGAIEFNSLNSIESEQDCSGVIDSRCYGCGRCLPVCPSQIIQARSYVSAPNAIVPLIEKMEIDAIEIHTSVGHERDFKRLWDAIEPISHKLKLLAISCPDDPEYLDYIHTLYGIIHPLPCALIWQTDGRPMSGDIGAGTTHAAIELARKALTANLPGYIQLAGGTNHYTVPKLKTASLLKEQKSHDRKISINARSELISGVAYGSYARSLLLPIIEELAITNSQKITSNLLDRSHDSLSNKLLQKNEELLWKAVAIADGLVSQIKLSVSTDSDI
jgi:Fe-S-cluster-containing hydrogenase component 2